MNARPGVRRQRGAVLFVSLIMLLIITLLAVSSMHELQLETRITGNQVEQQRLLSAAESALREGEMLIGKRTSALDACSASSNPCYVSIASSYATDFTTSKAYSGTDGATTLLRNSRWYARYISSSCSGGGGGSGNSYLSKRQSGCTYYYELNSQAYKGSGGFKACGPDALCVRSTYGLVVE